MAKKLTRETLEKMVMQVMNEAYVQQPTINVGAPASTLFGRKAALPKSGKAESEAVQFLKMIASDPKVPSNIKNQINDFLSYQPSTPEMKTDTEWDLETLPSANIQAITDETPTAQMSQAEKDAAQKKTAGSAYSSPQGITSPQKGRPAAPALKKPNLFSKVKKAIGLEEQIEQLVSQALEEMTKKKPVKDTKKPVKK